MFEPDRAELQERLDLVSKLFHFEGEPQRFRVEDFAQLARDEASPGGNPYDPRPIRDATTPLPPLTGVAARTEAPDAAVVAEDVLTLLSVVDLVLLDSVGHMAPLPMELNLLKDLRRAVSRFTRARAHQLETARRTMLMLRVSAIYEELTQFWRNGANVKRAEHILIGTDLNADQLEALDRAKKRLSRLMDHELGLEGTKLERAVSRLLVDGSWIKEMGGPVHAAASRLEAVAGWPAATLRRDREMSRLEITRLRNGGLRGFDPKEPGFEQQVADKAGKLVLVLAQEVIERRSSAETEKPAAT